MKSELSVDYLQRFVPSIFTEGSARRTSDKYSEISTMDILGKLEEKGFYLADAAQSYSQTQVNAKYAKHVLRLRHEDSRFCDNGLIPEIVLVNSHDGLCSYRLMSGIYRTVCANGLIAGESYHYVRICHQGDVMNDVIEGVYSVIDNNQKMLTSINEMSAIQLDTSEKKLIAQEALRLRLKNKKTEGRFDAGALINPRRFEELNKHDLFTVFNIVQENIIKGRQVKHFDDEGYFTYRNLRKITSIDQNEKINRGLWTFVEAMKQGQHHR